MQSWQELISSLVANIDELKCGTIQTTCFFLTVFSLFLNVVILKTLWCCDRFSWMSRRDGSTWFPSALLCANMCVCAPSYLGVCLRWLLMTEGDTGVYGGIPAVAHLFSVKSLWLLWNSVCKHHHYGSKGCENGPQEGRRRSHISEAASLQTLSHKRWVVRHRQLQLLL